MLVPKVSLPAAVRFLPEDLASLLRPGRVITARVETLKGRLLTLQVGEERLEALIEERVPLKFFKPGANLRLKVVSLGPPLVLSLSLPPPEGERISPERLFSKLIKKFPLLSEPEEEKAPELERLIFRVVEELSKETKTEKAPHQEARDFLVKTWQEGYFFLPLVFGDRVSWGYLYRQPQNQDHPRGEGLFVLRLYLSRLGFFEAHFALAQGVLRLDLYFAREEAKSLARQELTTLYEGLSASGLKVKLGLFDLSALPGSFLDASG